MNYQERSVLGKRKASVDLAAPPESLPSAPKRPLTKTALPAGEATFPSSPGSPLLIVSHIRIIIFMLIILSKGTFTSYTSHA